MPPRHKKKVDAAMKALTPQQKGFVTDWIANGMSARQAALKNGYSPSMADNITLQLSANVKSAMQALLAEQGITLSRLAEVEREILNGKDNKAKNKAMDRLYKIFGVLKDAGDGGAGGEGSPPAQGDKHLHIHLHEAEIKKTVDTFHAQLRSIYEQPEQPAEPDAR